ncbi:MAG: TIGR03016 family PEP-CTERM system-associated outer membrane protein [Aquabacterium sp.]
MSQRSCVAQLDALARLGLATMLRPLPLAIAAGLANPALAQSWVTRATLDAESTATTNGGRAPAGQQQRDLVLALRPTLAIQGDGPGLRVRASVGFDAMIHAQSEIDPQFLPRVNGVVNATLAERLLFVDAAVDVRRTAVDPYGPPADGFGVQNSRNATTLRLSPHFTRPWVDGMRWTVRHEATFSRSSDVRQADQQSERSEARIERRPAPWGGMVELTRQEVQSSGAVESQWRVESARAALDVAVGGDWVLGVLGGKEHSRFSLTAATDHRLGARLSWTPSERSQIKAEWENRFFGSGWDLEVRHRTPMLSLAMRWNRTPQLTTGSAGAVAAGADLATFLDAILTTRNPDPVARAVLVASLIASRGLDPRVPVPTDVMAEYAQLQSGLQLSATLLGTRNVVAVSMYRQTLEQLVRDGNPFVPGAAADNRQQGVAVTFSRRLTPRLSLNVRTSWSQITGLGDRRADQTRTQSHRAGVVETVSNRSQWSAGLQLDRLSTTVIGTQGYRAAAVYVGIQHRF